MGIDFQRIHLAIRLAPNISKSYRWWPAVVVTAPVSVLYLFGILFCSGNILSKVIKKNVQNHFEAFRANSNT